MASADAWRRVKISSWGEDGRLDMVEEAGGMGNVGCRLGLSPYLFFLVYSTRARADAMVED